MPSSTSSDILEESPGGRANQAEDTESPCLNGPNSTVSSHGWLHEDPIELFTTLPSLPDSELLSPPQSLEYMDICGEEAILNPIIPLPRRHYPECHKADISPNNPYAESFDSIQYPGPTIPNQPPVIYHSYPTHLQQSVALPFYSQTNSPLFTVSPQHILHSVEVPIGDNLAATNDLAAEPPQQPVPGQLNLESSPLANLDTRLAGLDSHGLSNNKGSWSCLSS
jgi:hypothetical protein